MALLTTYTDANKVVTSIKSDEVNKTMKWLNGYGNAWVVETVKRESFYYTGMDYATALACKAAMELAWTKDITDWTINDAGSLSDATSNKLVANIEVSNEGGNMWRCSVDVNWVTKTVTPIT